MVISADRLGLDELALSEPTVHALWSDELGRLMHTLRKPYEAD